MIGEVKETPFLLVLDTIDEDYAKAKKLLKKLDLSVSEKKIIEGWFLLRDSKLSEAISLVEKVITDSEFLNYQKFLVLGIAHNHQGNFKKALDCLKRSSEFIAKIKTTRKRFVLFYNLFLCYLNDKNLEGMKDSLIKLDSLEIKREIEKIAILRCYFNYYSFLNNFQQAEQILKKLTVLQEHMNESMRLGILIDIFDFHIKQDRLKEAMTTLEEMKNHRKFSVSASFKYMSKLLQNLIDGSPIYLYKKDFEDSEELWAQICVLQALESAQEDVFVSSWYKLVAVNSEVYRHDFSYHGDKCLFSVCYSKLKVVESSADFKIREGETKEDFVYRIFSSDDFQQINKEDLYKLIWGEEDWQMNRLEQLVSRVRVKFNLNIKFSKGKYSILNKKVS